MGISDVISLLGGIALFLFGMSLMGDGLKKVAGSKLELVLYRLSSTPLKGVLLGTGVTAVIQSSSATSVMVVGFVNSGMMKVRQAISVIMGAILGTSITGWILCLSYIPGGSGLVQLLSTEVITGIVAVIGIILRMGSGRTSSRHVGDILLGFAVLMYGMSAMSGAVSPLRESEEFIRILTSFSNPLLGILVGVAFTSVLQSASAAVGILQALSITGAITFEIAFPIIMGIAIGAAVPVLLSALGANLNGKRTAFVYLLIDVLGVVIWATVFYGLNAALHFPFLTDTMTAVSIALMNTLFRLATLVVLFPLIGAMERLVVFLFPDTGLIAEEQDMDRLEERFLQHPALSIEQSRLVTNSMAERAAGNLLDAMALRTNYSEKAFQNVEETESLIDRYEDKLGTYLMKITSRSLSATQSEEVSKFLHTISDFERISDHALNISQTAKEIHDKEVEFSAAALHELEVMESALREILEVAIEAFVSNDIQQAARVEPLEEIIDGLCDEMKSHHVVRLQSGVCTLGQGFIFNDLLTNYERVADHCSNIAVAIIELESMGAGPANFLTPMLCSLIRETLKADSHRRHDLFEAAGQTLSLHYVCTDPGQTAADFTFASQTLETYLAAGSTPDPGLTIPSSDGACTLTFLRDGRYVFQSAHGRRR